MSWYLVTSVNTNTPVQGMLLGVDETAKIQQDDQDPLDMED